MTRAQSILKIDPREEQFSNGVFLLMSKMKQELLELHNVLSFKALWKAGKQEPNESDESHIRFVPCSWRKHLPAHLLILFAFSGILVANESNNRGRFQVIYLRETKLHLKRNHGKLAKHESESLRWWMVCDVAMHSKTLRWLFSNLRPYECA